MYKWGGGQSRKTSPGKEQIGVSVERGGAGRSAERATYLGAVSRRIGTSPDEALCIVGCNERGPKHEAPMPLPRAPRTRVRAARTHDSTRSAPRHHRPVADTTAAGREAREHGSED